MGAPAIVYNGKTIDLLKMPFRNTFRVDPVVPRVINVAAGGAHEVVTEPRVDVHVQGEWQYQVGVAGLSEATYLTLRRGLEAWWQWAQQGLVWTLTMDSARTVSTTLNGAVSAGASSLILTSATGVTAGRPYVLKDGPYYQIVTILSIAGAPTVTINETLDQDFSDGAAFRDLFYWSLLIRDPRAPSPIIDLDYLANATSALEGSDCRLRLSAHEVG